MGPACVLLTIDQGATSGWSIWRGRQLLESGVARSCDSRAAVVHAAVEAGIEHGLPVIVMFEDHSKMKLTRGTRADKARKDKKPNRGTATLLGMGAARGWWEEHLRLASIPARRWLKADAKREWRAALGIRTSIRDPEERRKELKRQAVEFVRRMLGVTLSHDEAEAVCMGFFGTHHSREVVDTIPRKRGVA